MNPKEQNIINTLNLLVLLFRVRKQAIPKLTDEQQHTLKVTKEHLLTAEISIPIFINTLKTLDEKGYLIAVSIFEEKFHSEVKKFFSEEKYQEILKQIETIDTESLSEKLKVGIVDALEKKAPANHELDRAGLMNEEITLKILLGDARSVLADHTSEDISLIILMPFRSIERLLEKMNDGIKFDEIQDAGIWYDPTKYLFHIGDAPPISTIYNGKPNKEHFALSALMYEAEETRIDYIDIPEFDDTNTKETEKKSYRDALNRFIQKHPKLTEIFTVHSDHLEVHEEYLEHTH